MNNPKIIKKKKTIKLSEKLQIEQRNKQDYCIKQYIHKLNVETNISLTINIYNNEKRMLIYHKYNKLLPY